MARESGKAMIRVLVTLGLLLGAGIAAPAAASTTAGAHAFQFTSIEGEALPMQSFDGKVVLVVNTASRCGFTPQYEGLQALWERYRDRGFVVLGVPSGDFGGQELATASEIKQFCETTFAIDFHLTEKTHVTGDAAHPFYVWAGQELGFSAKPRWNFHKYLVARDGRLVDWFSTATGPSSKRVSEAIEAALAE